MDAQTGFVFIWASRKSKGEIFSILENASSLRSHTPAEEDGKAFTGRKCLELVKLCTWASQANPCLVHSPPRTKPATGQRPQERQTGNVLLRPGLNLNTESPQIETQIVVTEALASAELLGQIWSISCWEEDISTHAHSRAIDPFTSRMATSLLLLF